MVFENSTEHAILGIVDQITIELLSAAERRGTLVVLSASVSDNSGNSPQMAAPGRSRERGQRRAFMLIVIIDVYLVTKLVDYMDLNF